MSPPWMPLWIADFLGDTSHLDDAETGAYVLLIMHYWTAGSLPDDDKKLARIARSTPRRWLAMRPTIQAFFHDGWMHKRIDAELGQATVKYERRVAAGRAGGIASASARQSSSNRSTDATSERAASVNQLQPHLQRKEEDALRAPPTGNGVYAFEAGVIRLNQKDFEQWQDAYKHLDLKAELLALEQWAGEQAAWFHAVKGALAKRNREARAKASNAGELPLTPSGNRWPEGIV